MSWIETWLDTATAPPLATLLAALDQSGAKGINFYLGGRFSGGRGWTPQLSAELAQERPDVGQFGTWVSLSPGQGGYALGHQDGLDCVAAAKAYPAIAWLDYDVEPVTWQANPQGVDDAMRGFADAAHAAGYHTMDYGAPDTVAGASDEDVIWIANPNPGGGDPAIQPLDPAYYAGKRAVQYGTGTFGGVVWDVTHAEFSIAGGTDMTPEQDQRLADVLYLLLFGAAPRFADPAQNPMGWSTPDGKGHLTRVAEVLTANDGSILTALGVEKSEVDAMLAAVKTPAPVDVDALAAALIPHLPTGADPQVVAKAVAAELGKALDAAP